jgi:hypothetical protein
MSIIQTMSFNWLPRLSPYAKAQNWRTHQQALNQQSMDILTIAGDSLLTAAANRISGRSNLAAQAALDRINAAANAKSNAVQRSSTDTTTSSSSSTSSPWVSLPDGSSVYIDPSTYLAGGSKINLDAGTLILSDGTVIDTTTGLKKVDVTT